MATGIFCTIAEVERKAGANASATSKAEAYVDDYTTQVESMINTLIRFNFSDTYSTLNTDVQGILKEVCSNLVAIYVIQYDMSGFTSLIEAEDMITVLRDASLRGLSLLKDKKQTTFIKNA